MEFKEVADVIHRYDRVQADPSLGDIRSREPSPRVGTKKCKSKYFFDLRVRATIEGVFCAIMVLAPSA